MKDILLKYGTIYPITFPPMKGADVRIENGKIKEIGYDLPVYEQSEVIDVSGKYVFPGFIDVHTHLGLYDEGTGWAGNDANETIETMTPHVRAIDSVYPLDPGFRDAIEHGLQRYTLCQEVQMSSEERRQSLKRTEKTSQK